MAGAKDFVREGLLDDVDGVVGMHVMPDLYAGSIGLKEGIKPHRMSCLLQPLFCRGGKSLLVKFYTAMSIATYGLLIFRC